MIDVKKLIKLMQIQIEGWHATGYRWDFPQPMENSLEEMAIRCAYHNYCIWHMIEDYQHQDTKQILFVYHGGLEHNKFRNLMIESMDREFENFQKDGGAIASETLGSVIDRIGIQFIKICHLKDSNDPRLETVERQTAFLIRCACELFDDTVAGRRQCVFLSRFKTSGYNPSTNPTI